MPPRPGRSGFVTIATRASLLAFPPWASQFLQSELVAIFESMKPGKSFPTSETIRRYSSSWREIAKEGSARRCRCIDSKSA